jgi:hypothetical protein
MNNQHGHHSYYVYMSEYDSSKGQELRMWARENGDFNLISVARGENPSMYVYATPEMMEKMKNTFSWVLTYRRDPLKLYLILE